MSFSWISRATHADALHQAGRRDDSLRLFREVEAMPVWVPIWVTSAETDGTQQTTPTEFKVRPIGYVQKMGEQTVIVLDKKYQGCKELPPPKSGDRQGWYCKQMPLRSPLLLLVPEISRMPSGRIF